MSLLKFPAVIINFKTYSQATGRHALLISRVCEEVSEDSGVSFIVCPGFTDLRLIASNVKLPVFAQGLSVFPPGSHTGSVSVEHVKKSGCSGVLINHSENKLLLDDIEKLVKLCSDEGLVSCVCVANEVQALAVKAFNPDIISVEPPELIGSKDSSVSKDKPNVIKDSVKNAGSIPLLAGAGIKSSEDFKVALKMGAKGVLLASAVCKASDPKRVLLELVKGIK